jgi:hypothetical protein
VEGAEFTVWEGKAGGLEVEVDLLSRGIVNSEMWHLGLSVTIAPSRKEISRLVSDVRRISVNAPSPTPSSYSLMSQKFLLDSLLCCTCVPLYKPFNNDCFK